MKLTRGMLALAGGLLISASLAANAQIAVRIGPPPPPPVEVVPVVPHPGWVWQPGFWRWNGFRYVWIRGAYIQPPFWGARWIPGHWRPTPTGYVWVPGHWLR